MKRALGSIDNSPSVNSSTNDNEQRVEVIRAGLPRAENLLNTEFYIEMKYYFIDRIMEFYDDAHSILLNLKRINRFFENLVNEYLSSIINNLHKPDIHPLFGFKDLTSDNLGEAPCLRIVQIKDQVNDLEAAVGPTFKIPMRDDTFRYYTFTDNTSQFRKTLILYFAAKSNPHSIVCKTYVEIFESHLASFKSLWEDYYFRFSSLRTHFSQSFSNWVFFPFSGRDLAQCLFLNINSPCSAYLFAHFLNTCVLSSKIFQFIGYSEEKALIVTSFLKKYKNYELVSNTITDFINAVFLGLEHYDMEIVANSLEYLDQFTQLGLIDKSFAKKSLFPAATQFLSNTNSNVQEDALNLINSLLKEGLFEKSFIENPGFKENLEEVFINSSTTCQGFASLILLFLINYNNKPLILKSNLIEKIFAAR
ncbi:MAG: hypothetical protein C5B43_02385, partial [Verrucomicrobia bacterium]